MSNNRLSSPVYLRFREKADDNGTQPGREHRVFRRAASTMIEAIVQRNAVASFELRLPEISEVR